MNTVFNRELTLPDGTIPTQEAVGVHEKAEVISVACSRGQIVVWFVGDQNKPEAEYRFMVVGAANVEVPDDYNYAGTAVENKYTDRAYHVFYTDKPADDEAEEKE